MRQGEVDVACLGSRLPQSHCTAAAATLLLRPSFRRPPSSTRTTSRLARRQRLPLLPHEHDTQIRNHLTMTSTSDPTRAPPSRPSGSSPRPSTSLTRPTRRDILALLTDAHCHPTDDPTLSSGDRNGAQKLAQRMEKVPMAGVCAMSSCTEDQVLVRQLAEGMQKRRAARGKAKEEDKEDEEDGGDETPIQLRPCFGELHRSCGCTSAMPSVSLDAEKSRLALSQAIIPGTRTPFPSTTPPLPARNTTAPSSSPKTHRSKPGKS